MEVSELLTLLDKAETPFQIRVAIQGLEASTGISTRALLASSKAVIGSFNTTTAASWYRENGYYKIAEHLGGSFSHAGISIHSGTALESTAVYACVKIIAEDLGTLPFFPYRRSGPDREIEKAFDHPLYQTLHDLPNPELGAGEFVEMLTAHAALGLDGYAEIERSRTRIYLWPWLPQEVRTDRNSRGALFFIRKRGNEPEKTFAREQVFHLRGFTLDGMRSDPILIRARQAIGITLAAQEYAGRFFAQDANPGIILQRPLGAPALGPEVLRDVKAAWKAWHQGLAQSHEPAILQDGTTALRLDPDHQKLQMIESRKFQVVEVARLYRMPLHKLADLDRATFANIEHQSIEYVQHTLSPWIRRWRQAVYRCLLTEDERLADSLYAEHEIAGLLRGDFAAQSEGFRKLLEKGVYSINEVRRLMNLNPVDGGDEHFIQLNMGTVQDVAAGAGVGATV